MNNNGTNGYIYIYMLYPNAYKPYIAAYLFIQRNRNIKTTGWASKKPTVIASNMCTRINVYTYCIYIYIMDRLRWIGLE